WTVTSPEASITLTPDSASVGSLTVNPGDTITVTFANGPGNPMDWVTLGRVTAANGGYDRWMFLNGATTTPATGITNTTLQFVAPPAAGTYEIRWPVTAVCRCRAASRPVAGLAPPPA